MICLQWVHHITVEDTRKPTKLSDQASARRYVLPLNIDVLLSLNCMLIQCSRPMRFFN